MISFLHGKVVETFHKSITLDVNGVGYKVFMTEDSLHGINTGKEIKLFTHMVVRDDAMDLYGFKNTKDREYFELLITISGIGPKTAMNILGMVSAEALFSAVRTGSTAHLVKVSGIGRKMAEKIVLELKDKVTHLSSDGQGFEEMSSDIDVIEALRALGFETEDAREALKKVDKSISDTGAKVKASLKFLK